MTLPLYSEGDGSRGKLGASSASAEDRVGTASRLSQQGLSQAKLLPALRGALLDDGTDTFNRVCTHIAIIMLGGLLAIYLETL